MRFYSILILLTIFSNLSFALTPNPEFILINKMGGVQNYRDEIKKIDLIAMDSEFEFNDLSANNLQELEDHFKTKKEYGKMFGFNDWTAKDKKFFDDQNKRLIVVEGDYKDSEKKTVYFLEVYWADKKKSGQYLITSESGPIKCENYKQYLK